ncbi:hypothetical protein [Mesorhizobium carmichaelinearum]|uniref:hypothetical protein n=1 Tax=Mesorhizobium carmichaelinearum TaxID=1208188 RepID=UPI001AEC816C|nr:hypothetical protein [Mesorhizobium carmichaelinearum]
MGQDEPVTLAEACRLFFGGRLSPSALRTEAAKGRLTITQIARKDFVTRRAIEEMMVACRRPVKTESKTDSRTTAATAQEALRIKLANLGKAKR